MVIINQDKVSATNDSDFQLTGSQTVELITHHHTAH